MQRRHSSSLSSRLTCDISSFQFPTRKLATTANVSLCRLTAVSSGRSGFSRHHSSPIFKNPRRPCPMTPCSEDQLNSYRRAILVRFSTAAKLILLCPIPVIKRLFHQSHPMNHWPTMNPNAHIKPPPRYPSCITRLPPPTSIPQTSPLRARPSPASNA
jgi:hypothetical protein